MSSPKFLKPIELIGEYILGGIILLGTLVTIGIG